MTLTGNRLVNSWSGVNLASSISCANESNSAVLGDFEIGANVHSVVTQNAQLTLGGKRLSSASGIPCNSRIMVESSLTIGFDCIIAWDVFTSDSNWHDIAGTERCSPVLKMDHVWIFHGVSVVKGALIPAGCIVGAKSLVNSVFETENAFIADIPANLLNRDVEWAR